MNGRNILLQGGRDTAVPRPGGAVAVASDGRARSKLATKICLWIRVHSRLSQLTGFVRRIAGFCQADPHLVPVREVTAVPSLVTLE